MLVLTNLAACGLSCWGLYWAPSSTDAGSWQSGLACGCAGALGSILCNLRGIFIAFYREHRFLADLEIPFHVRIAMGWVLGLCMPFLGSVTVSTLAEGVTPNRAGLIALSMIAGFAALEFCQRMKETARTLFSVERNPAGSAVESSSQR